MDCIKGQYVVVIAAVALIVGYVVGIGYGRDDTSRAWRTALSKVESDGCRDAVRDSLREE